VAGGLIVSEWGGFKKKRLRGMLIGWGMSGVLGFVCFGLGRSLYAWIPLAALAAMGFPLAQSASNAIWQSKVAPDVQGRVFAARRFIAWLTDPIMPVVAGALADYVTEPAMTTSTSLLSGTFSWLTGTEPGSGMALQYVFAGILYLIVILVGLNIPSVRNVETILPDYEQPKETVAEAE
jgi:hypothetical protein